MSETGTFAWRWTKPEPEVFIHGDEGDGPARLWKYLEANHVNSITIVSWDEESNQE